MRLPSCTVLVLLAVVLVVVIPIAAGQDRPNVLPEFDDGAFSDDHPYTFDDTLEAPAPTEEEVVVASGIQHLSDLPWSLATTGWVATGEDPTPKRDLSFQGRGISLGGTPYDKGIGTFPFSEIVVDLDDQADYFQAAVGIEDDLPGPDASVRFFVFVDDTLVAQTGVLRGGDPPHQVRAPVAGGRRLRLVVTDADDRTENDFAVWAEARLVSTEEGGRERAERAREELAQRTQRRRQDAHAAAAGRVQRRAAEDVRTLSRVVGRGWGSAPAQGAFDQREQRLVLSNGSLAVFLGFGGEQNGSLTVVRLPSGEPVLSRMVPRFIGGGGNLSLHPGTVPQSRGAYRLVRVTDPALGDALELEARYRLLDSADEVLTIRLRLADAFPALVYQIDLPPRRVETPPRAVRYLDPEEPALVAVDEDVRYLTDSSQIRQGTVTDDGLWRRDLVGLSKPVVVWSRESGRGLVLSVLDEVDLPARLLLRRELGSPTAAVSLEQPLVDRPTRSLPRLYIEAVHTPEFREVFRNYRAVMARLYPSLPVPSWVKYQWLSWYVYNTDVTDTDIRRHIDYIADHLADLGPWNVLVDAGWYISEGREGGEWRAPDFEKFPFGLRDLVDYAHERGVRVILYFSSPFLEDKRAPRNWLGLRGIIDEHPEWLIPLPPDGEVRRYVYNYQNPELRGYMTEVLQDFFLRYGVDGVKLDGLGGGEGPMLAQLFYRDLRRGREYLGQTMEIYRFTHQAIANLGIRDFYIESGWVTPVFAHPYAHVFRYGDESPSFSYSYPFPGLKEHIDYSLFQHLLGQRGNMGALYMDPNEEPLALSWLEASLALGMQATLSFYLPGMTSETLSAVRERLVQFTAFRDGVTHLGPGWPPETFSTTVDGTTYLGILNRDRQPKTFALSLADYGLDPRRTYAVFSAGAKRSFRARERITVRQPGNNFQLLVMRTEPGVLWTNSSFQTHPGPQHLTVQVQGPEAIDGFLLLHVPRPIAVRIDGEAVEPGPDFRQFQYNDRVRVLRIAYPHDRPHTIEITYGQAR